MMDKRVQNVENENKSQLPTGNQSSTFQPLKDEREYILNSSSEDKSKGENKSSFVKRIKKGAWVLALVAAASLVIFATTNTSKSVDTSKDAAQAIETHMSTTLGVGTRLLSNDQNIIGQDYTISHTSTDDETVIWIWDYAAEDGDYVQVIVDGVALGDPFMIKNKAVPYKVPTVGEVQVVGTRDGGGGITYGVYYELNETTYFNGMDEGDGNLYTLIRE